MTVHMVIQVLGYATTVGFAYLAGAAAWAWGRERTPGTGYPALALGTMAGVTMLARVEALAPVTTRPLAAVSVVLFQLSGYAFLLYRGTLVPLSRTARTLVAGALITSGGVLVVTGSAPPGEAPTRLQFAGAVAVILTWALCMAEPILRLWLVSRSRPAVQRARLRALSGGYAGIVLILLLAIGPRQATQTDAAQLGFALGALALVPLLSIIFAPPEWLRRRWRSREESELRHAMKALLLYAPDRATLAGRGLEWALRLVGGEHGLVLDADGALLARRGVVDGEVPALLHQSGPPPDARPSGLSGERSSTAITTPLRSTAGVGTLIVAAGPFTPRFGAEELRRLEEYAESLSVALDRVRLHEELVTVAATDTLTGLCNRGEFERIVAAPLRGPFALLAIDVDRLKLINDTYGHEAGDQALRAIATALRMGVRDGDTVARTGGDEFAAFLPGADARDGSAAAERLRHSMYGVPLAHGVARISIGCAVGGPGDDPAVVWGQADEALYRAKGGGRDRCELALPHAAMAPTGQTRRWATIIPSLLVQQGMTAVFQPVVDLHTGTTVGFEALGRPPGQPAGLSVEHLFETADRLGRGRDLDWVCRRAAVHEARELPPGAMVFLNVGVSALLDPLHDVDQMLLLLQWARRSPDTVVLELTEREAVHDIDRLVEVVAAYRQHGFRFALDDVGAGHSTFEVLAATVPEFVKISEKLTRRATEIGAQSTIGALIAFALWSGGQLIAEGLETDEGVHLMRRLGVALGQGYALGLPAAASHWRGAGGGLHLTVVAN
jgi:diguanylate cyclase (GGDEF)-like protein